MPTLCICNNRSKRAMQAVKIYQSSPRGAAVQRMAAQKNILRTLAATLLRRQRNYIWQQKASYLRLGLNRLGQEAAQCLAECLLHSILVGLL